MRRKWFVPSVLSLLLLGFLILPRLEAQWNMTLGAYGSGIFFSDIGPDVITLGSGETSFILDYRSDFIGGNSFQLNSNIDLSGATNPDWHFFDRERVGTVTFLPTDFGSITLKAKILSSLFGEPRYLGSCLNPEYDFKFLFTNGDFPMFMEARGAALFKSGFSNEDYLLQGVRLGLRSEKTIKNVVETGVGISYIGYLDTAVWSGAIKTNVMRLDALILMDFGMEGVTDYLVSWSWCLDMGLRLSNANAYYNWIPFLNEQSEARTVSAMKSSVTWQVTDLFSLHYESAAAFSLYMGRQALTDFLTLRGEKAFALDLSVNLRLEWMVVKYLNIVAETIYAQTFSNDKLLQIMDIKTRFGVEYTF
jgi:hypothetical protein